MHSHAVSDEARAKKIPNLTKKGGLKRYQGLTMWTPNINISRDPRWGMGTGYRLLKMKLRKCKGLKLP